MIEAARLRITASLIGHVDQRSAENLLGSLIVGSHDYAHSRRRRHASG